jgi:hypothetical protein
MSKPALIRSSVALRPKSPDQATPANAETASIAEIAAVTNAFKDRKTQDQKRFVQATDSEYWCCLCFQTREQKDEFLAKMNLADLGDKYLDGIDVAKRLHITLTSETPAMPRLSIDRKFTALAQKPPA